MLWVPSRWRFPVLSRFVEGDPGGPGDDGVDHIVELEDRTGGA